ncbi:MAG: DUF5666 domain-containing protein [Anaerolineae bacterium]
MKSPRNTARYALVGLLVSLTALASIKGAHSAATDPIPSNPDTTVSGPTGPRSGGAVLAPADALRPGGSGEPAISAAAPYSPADQAADELGPAPCRVVGAPLVIEPAPGDTWAWSTLQNAGDEPAAPVALEIGWSGDAQLAEVVLELPGAARARLHDGSLTSPAVVSLALDGGGSPGIAPGETARLGVRFEPDAPGVAVALGPAVLFMSEGCQLALGPMHESECPLALTGVRVSGNDPRRVTLSATNTSAAPVQLRGMDVHWPTTDNGSLQALYVGGRLIHEFQRGLKHSPAAIDLDKILDDPLVLEPGSPTSLWLAFERPVADAPYVVTVAVPGGCLATATTWLSAPGCGVGVDGLETQGKRAQVVMSNVLPAAQTLEALDVFWPSGPNGPLVSARLNGRQVWRGSESDSPARLSLGDDASLAGNASAILELEFDPQSAVNGGSEPASSSSVAGRDYTIVAGLRGGCRLVYSTVSPDAAAGCSVSAGEIVANQGQSSASVGLTNSGGAVTLSRLAVSWPTRNGSLTSVSLGALSLFRGRQPATSEPFVLTFSSADAVVLDGHSAAQLVLGFESMLSPSGHALALSFDNAAGEPCSDLVITPPPQDVACALTVTGLEAEGERNIQFWVRNDGLSEVELQYLSVVWPAGEGLNQLVSVFVVEGDNENLLWTGNQRHSPALVPLSGERAAIIDPGETVRLRLHFIQLVGVQDPAAELKLTVGTAEGCLAFYPNDDRGARPETESFNGTIVELPERTWGDWIVQVGSGAERQHRLVTVDEQTRFEPPTLSPAVGDAVRVEALVMDEGDTTVWRALRITLHSTGQRVTYIGRITDIDSSSPDQSRPEWLRIDGFVGLVRLVDATRVEGDLRLGARVEVQGTLGSNGSLVASYVTVREEPIEQLVTVRGVVQDSRTAYEIQSGLQLWFVSKYRVEVDTAVVDSALVPQDRLPAKGERVEVRGRLSGNRIVATRVSEAAAPVTASVVGTIVSLPFGSVLGTWQIATDDGREVAILVESASVVDARSAPALPGMRVTAVVEELPGGGNVALGMRLDWPD